MFSKNDGTSSYGTITTLAESPVLPGVLWAGTDDGNVQMSKGGGATWSNVAEKIANMPKTHQVSRVEPSHFDAGTCYVTFDGHRSDDLKSNAEEDVKITISDIDGKVVRNLIGPKSAGINRVQWNPYGNPPQRPADPLPAGAPAAGAPPTGMQAGMGAGGGGGMGRFGAMMGTPLEPGVYVVKLTVGGRDYTTKVRVEEDSYRNQ
jgi:hypothetical protein